MFRQTQVLVGDGYIYEYLCVISNSHFILSLNLLEVINLRFPICSTQNAANLPVELCFFGVSDQPAVKPWKVDDFRIASDEMSSEKDPEGMWPQLVGPPNGSQVGAHNSNFTMVYDTQITIVNED